MVGDTFALTPTWVSQDVAKADDPCSRPTSQTAANRCAADRANRAEDEMQRVYGQLLAMVGDNADIRPQIEATEKAWLAYRDAYLEAAFPGERKNQRYGSMYSMLRSALRQRLAEQHTANLKELLYRHGGSK
jgi:uncharacterized protein YecT (DUF1311 family)